MKKEKSYTRQIYDNRKRFIGSLIRMEGNDIILATDNYGTFIGIYDGENTLTLPDRLYHSTGNNLYELVLGAYKTDGGVAISIIDQDIVSWSNNPY